MSTALVPYLAGVPELEKRGPLAFDRNRAVIERPVEGSAGDSDRVLVAERITRTEVVERVWLTRGKKVA